MISDIKFFFNLNLHKYIYTVTSCLFMHIVSTEKLRKDMRDRKDMRELYFYYTFKNLFTLFISLKTED